MGIWWVLKKWELLVYHEQLRIIQERKEILILNY